MLCYKDLWFISFRLKGLSYFYKKSYMYQLTILGCLFNFPLHNIQTAEKIPYGKSSISKVFKITLLTKEYRKTGPFYLQIKIRRRGFWCSFRPLLHHTSSAHHSHSAPELLSLSNCIKLWGKLVLVQYDANIWC